MTEYLYTEQDRYEQLSQLATELRRLVIHLNEANIFVDKIGAYETAIDNAESLIKSGFEQSDLSLLSRTVPDLFYRHKEWMPPLEQDGDGKWCEPLWFQRLETFLQPVLQSAKKLQVLGHY